MMEIQTQDCLDPEFFLFLISQWLVLHSERGKHSILGENISETASYFFKVPTKPRIMLSAQQEPNEHVLLK